MGLCNSNDKETEKSEDFIQRIFSFKDSSNFNYFKVLEELKTTSVKDEITIQEFETIMVDFFSTDFESRRFQKLLFTNFFLNNKIIKMHINELLFLLIPFMNMPINEKLALFKTLVEFLLKNKNHFFSHNLKEILSHYYYISTCFVNKLMIRLLEEEVNKEIDNKLVIKRTTSSVFEENFNLRLNKRIDYKIKLGRDLALAQRRIYSEHHIDNEVVCLFNEVIFFKDVLKRNQKKKFYEVGLNDKGIEEAKDDANEDNIDLKEDKNNIDKNNENNNNKENNKNKESSYENNDNKEYKEAKEAKEEKEDNLNKQQSNVDKKEYNNSNNKDNLNKEKEILNEINETNANIETHQKLIGSSSRSLDSIINFVKERYLQCLNEINNSTENSVLIENFQLINSHILNFGDIRNKFQLKYADAVSDESRD